MYTAYTLKSIQRFSAKRPYKREAFKRRAGVFAPRTKPRPLRRAAAHSTLTIPAV